MEFEGPENSRDQKLIVELYEKELGSGTVPFFDVSEFESIVAYYQGMGKLKKAIKAGQIGLEQHPFSLDLMLSNAQLLVSAGEQNKAFELLEKAEGLYPNDPDLIFVFGSIHLQSNNKAKAREYFKSLESITDEPDETFFNIGFAYQINNCPDEAIEYYKRSLEENPEHEDALDELLYNLEVNERLREEFPYFEKFVEENPYLGSAWFNLGLVFKRIGQPLKARQAFEYAYHLDEDNTEALFQLGEVLMNLGQHEKALKCFKRVLESEEGDYDSYLNIGHCFLQLFKFNKAIDAYKKAHVMDQGQGDPWFFIGKIMEAQEKWLEAAHFFRKGSQAESDKDHYWSHLAAAEHKLGNFNAAQDAYEQALILNPESPANYQNFGEFYLDQGLYKEATEVLKKGSWEFPEDPTLQYELVVAQYNAGEAKEALLNLQNALALNFDEHKILFRFFPDLEENKALSEIIKKYKEKG